MNGPAAACGGWALGSCRMLFALGLVGCEAEPPPPDVLLVVEDTVRADALSVYGNPRPTSPQLAEVARVGVTFDDVTAPSSWTWPTHASLFTGLQPWEHGAHFGQADDAGAWSLDPLPLLVTMPRSDVPTLAERFSQAGYRTVLLTGNPIVGPDLKAMVRGFELAEVHRPDAALISRAETLLAETDPRPLFLFVNLMPAHAPYHLTPASWAQPHRPALQPETAPDWLVPYLTTDRPGVDLQQRPSGQDRTGIQQILAGELSVPPEGWTLLQDLYDGEIMEADLRLNRVLQAWTAAHPQGVMAITSDHGEGFGEHGLLEHRGSVYPEVTRVPLAIAAPGLLPAGTRISTPVSLTRLGATLRALALGTDRAGSWLPLIAGEPYAERPIQAAAWPDPYRADKVGGRWKQSWFLYRKGDEALVFDSAGNHQLYDMARDPQMEHPLETQPERASALFELARQAFPELQVRESSRPSEEIESRLQALGYLE